MAGMKGRSGGARPGAGRKLRHLDIKPHADPAQFLLAVMNSPTADAQSRLTAARALLPFVTERTRAHAKSPAPRRLQQAAQFEAEEAQQRTWAKTEARVRAQFQKEKERKR